MLSNPLTRRIFFPLIFVLALAWTLASRPAPDSAPASSRPPSPYEGFSAPDFTLSTMDGSQVSLSDLRGKVVLLNFWASWCLPCQAEMPAMEDIYRSHKDLGLEILAVNTTSQDSLDDASAFAGNLGLTFPIPLDLDGSVSQLYDIRGMPTSYFIDRDGIIQEVVVGGPMSAALIQSRVEDLLEDGQ